MNFPVQLTSFIGRAHDLAEVERLLGASRLVTLTGAGGCGKTRLALQVGAKMRSAFPDGVWMVDLSVLREAEQVSAFTAQALGLRAVTGQPLLEVLLRWVESRKLLLILDNCEHLIAACARLVGQLLSHAPDLQILATSREPLAVSGEVSCPVRGLAWPPVDTGAFGGGRRELAPQNLMAYDAVRLFVDRARAISPDFRITTENAAAIGEICQRLDGLPLAIELASARVNVLTVQEIAARLDDRFALLTSGQRAGFDPRHQTLRAAIDWSYTLLTGEERTLLRRLAVFAAGCTLDTAEAVCSGDGIEASRTLDLLSSLVDKSLITAETAGRAQARYRLLETLREYALEKLNQSGEAPGLRDRHLALFLTRAEEASPKLFNTYQQLWLNWLEGENDNLRAALAWALESGQIETGLRIAISLLRFWEIRSFVPEALSWFERLLARADEQVSLLVRANAYTFASFLAVFLAKAEEADSFGRKAAALAEAAGDAGSQILILARNSLDSGAKAVGDFQAAFEIGEQRIQQLRKTSGPSIHLGMTLLAQGEAAIEVGNFERAREVLEESLSMAREDGDLFRIAHTMNSLGDLARCLGRFAEAQTDYENSAALLRELGARHTLAAILRNLGRACLLQGEAEQACSHYRESMALYQTEQFRPGMAECLVGFSAAALMCDLPAAGARLLAAAAAIGEQRWAALVWPARALDYDAYLSQARAGLSEAAFQAEQAAGQAMTVEQAIAFAQSLPLKTAPAPTVRENPGDLTARECEIAALIAKGKTNIEIAQELVLSKRTVEKHAANILSKLGLTHRTQIVRWAIEQQL